MEKGTLQYASAFGIDNDISVAVCGSSISAYQMNLLLSLGVKEVVFAFDKQFQEKGDKEFQKLTKNLENIHLKYSSMVKVSFIFDKYNLLGYKDSPIDKGKDIFLELFQRRINLY
jgi:hypothetical protein